MSSSVQDGKAGRPPTVVVGVDGSAGATAALRWALAEARLRKSPIRIVHAWMFGYSGGSIDGSMYWGDGLGPSAYAELDLSTVHRAAEDLLERAVAEAGAGTDGIEVERRVIQAPAAEALIAAAGPDDLLVVGSRGHGGFSSLLLGSVSRTVLQHSAVPVVVIRHRE